MAADILQLTWALFATQIEDEIRHCTIKTSIFISLPCKTTVKEPNKRKLWKGKENILWQGKKKTNENRIGKGGWRPTFPEVMSSARHPLVIGPIGS